MSEQQTPEVSEAFVLTCNMLFEAGYKNLVSMEGVVEFCISDDWLVVFNPHGIEVSYQEHSMSPVSMMAIHKEMPVLTFGHSGGADLMGAEDDYITAVKKKLALLKEKPTIWPSPSVETKLNAGECNGK